MIIYKRSPHYPKNIQLQILLIAKIGLHLRDFIAIVMNQNFVIRIMDILLLVILVLLRIIDFGVYLPKVPIFVRSNDIDWKMVQQCIDMESMNV